MSAVGCVPAQPVDGNPLAHLWERVAERELACHVDASGVTHNLHADCIDMLCRTF